MTEWRDIKEYPGYSVSSSGDVRVGTRSTARGVLPAKILKATINLGYPTVWLRNGSKRKNHYVHRLVLQAFYGDCPKGMEACHNNGDRSDCRLENLRWDSRSANWHDSVKHGSRNPGMQNKYAYITAMDVERVRDLAKQGQTQKRIAKWLGIGQTSVNKILINYGRFNNLVH